jgi:hypothetical protein
MGCIATVRSVQLLFPAVKFAHSPAFERGFVGNGISEQTQTSPKCVCANATEQKTKQQDSCDVAIGTALRNTDSKHRAQATQAQQQQGKVFISMP